MKRNLLLFLLLFSTNLLISQSRTELGITLGTSYYQGDINNSRLFYSPSMTYGIIVKYNLNNYLSTRVKGFYGKLGGSDYDFSEIENQLRGASFSTSFIDLSASIEFSFLPYTSSGYIKKNKNRFAPYMFIGIGGNFLFSSEGFENPVTIPFGLGIKYNIFERLTLGLEWSYRKTFTDEIDGVLNVQDVDNTPVIHNDDWYSLCGVFVTYKLFRDKIDCPTYYK
ncbi:MAG: outer membrane beta-barrel protein [Bacteroidales bacterium]|nr:outer membrane beta-barrel protein [Bacteroidales bacterium]